MNYTAFKQDIDEELTQSRNNRRPGAAILYEQALFQMGEKPTEALTNMASLVDRTRNEDAKQFYSSLMRRLTRVDELQG